MDPLVLREVCVDISLLSHRKWLMASVIDTWLLSLWKSMARPKFRYIPSIFLHAQVTSPIEENEIKHFRSFFDMLPPYGMVCP